jgi:hypothetical protein
MLQEIRIDSFFPADETTAAHAWTAPARGEAGSHPPSPNASAAQSRDRDN